MRRRGIGNRLGSCAATGPAATALWSTASVPAKPAFATLVFATLAFSTLAFASLTLATPGAAQPTEIERTLARATKMRDEGVPGETARDEAARDAFRQRILAIADLGIPHLALDEAAAWPEALRAEDWHRLWGDRAAKEVIWGELPPASAARRFEGTDAALARLAEVAQRLPSNVRWPRRRQLQDHLVALRDRQRMAEAIAVYEQLLTMIEANDEQPLQPARELPGWVLVAAADAYLYEEQPEVAERLYRRALELRTNTTETSLSHFYALLEDERLQDALESIDLLAEALPAWFPSDQQDGSANWDKPEVDATAALARGFVDLPAQAETRLQPLVTEAPYNQDLRRALGSVYYWRGWSRRALAEFEITLAYEPESVASRLACATVLADLGHFDQADTEITAIRQTYPEHLHAYRLGHAWDVQHRWEVVVEGESGDSTGVTFGNRDYRLEAWVYAPPWRHRLRPYLHAFYAEARFPEGIGRFERLGLGAAYQGASSRNWGYRLRAEVHDNWDGQIFSSASRRSGRFGYLLAAEVEPNDDWSFSLDAERRSATMPLRGWRLGIDTDRLGLGIGYRRSELTRIDLRLAAADFSDGNRRRTALLSAQQRLFSNPRWHLTLLPELYASDNSRRDAPYYNPESDATFSLGLMTEFLGWRRYEDSLHHRLVVTTGRYQQHNFDDRTVVSVRYEHDWRLGPELGLRYGLGWASRVFDGEREERVWIYFSTDWRPGPAQARGGAS